MPDVSATSAGQAFRGYRRGGVSTDPVDQYVIPQEDRIVTYRGRSATFVTPGRAAVTQRLMTIHNASGSTVLCSVNRVIIDLMSLATKAVTIVPPILRAHRFVPLPTGGTALGKVPLDSSLTSSASVVVTGDSSADGTAQAGTLSGTALSVTNNPATPLAQINAPRQILAGTAASQYYEPVDTVAFFVGEPDVILRANEGLAISLDQAIVTTGNPSTDKWNAYVDWTEFTRP